MNRSDFDARRWKLSAWQWDAEGQLWFLGGYLIIQDDVGLWHVDAPLGRRVVPPCANLTQAQEKCEREIIEGLLNAVEEA